MSKMTSIKGVPDRGDARPGMAYFAGSGPPGKRCGQCVHRTYFDSFNNRKYGCAEFFRMTGRHGPAIGTFWSACKYFKERPDADKN